ncbi:aryl-sulfate sulfotransferase [Pseudofulvibacter geojedonensis]|uniref:Aryl-sulfate sulfotransferase n=1 Tax=Pseudofulvibacter geojedonensis TaxID=1123758 RepID=A0ABW3I4C8_9FLAO
MRGIIFFLCTVCFVQAQTTIGLLHYNSNVSDGYLLFGHKQDNDVYLINNCGEVVNHWLTDNRLGVAYLLDNGNLLKSGGGFLELRDWDNSLLWKVDLTVYGLDQHHDIEPMPNGNVLVLSRDVYTSAEAIAQGRNPSLVNTELRSEKIVEIQPVGTNSLNVVWEWKIWDHLIQDFSAAQPNFGVVANHPELLDLNLGTSSSNWIHANAVEYNETLDQIVFSSRKMNEIYVIDHSTTILEAASHTGGNSGKGGDFLWRWGNPINYDQGTAGDQKLYGQHDPKWIPNGYPNAGKLSLFNNGTGRTPEYSSVHIIDTQVDINGNYSISGSFLPNDFFWSWDGSVLGTTVFSNSQSGANVQPNGNVLFCETVPGRISEIDSSGNLVWSYENPIGTSNYVQGDMIPNSQNQVFRAEKYPANFVGFTGKDLTPIGIIENINSISDNCKTLNVEEFVLGENRFKIYPNPINYEFKISGEESIESIQVFNLTGKIVLEYTQPLNSYKVSELPPGMYFVKIRTKKGARIKKIIKE